MNEKSTKEDELQEILNVFSKIKSKEETVRVLENVNNIVKYHLKKNNKIL